MGSSEELHKFSRVINLKVGKSRRFTPYSSKWRKFFGLSQESAGVLKLWFNDYRSQVLSEDFQDKPVMTLKVPGAQKRGKNFKKF